MICAPLIYGGIFHEVGRPARELSGFVISPSSLAWPSVSSPPFASPLFSSHTTSVFLFSSHLLHGDSLSRSFSHILSSIGSSQAGRPAGQVEPDRAALGDRATNTRGELCLPFVKILDVSLIGMSGGSRAYPEERRRKKEKRTSPSEHARRYGEPLTARRYAANLLTAHNDHGRTERNLLSKRSQSRERNRARKLRGHTPGTLSLYRFVSSTSVDAKRLSTDVVQPEEL